MKASLVGATFAALCTVSLLAGCGEETEPTADDTTTTTSESPAPSATPTQPAGTTCAEIWVAGAPFPEDYAGCEVDGAMVSAEPINCESGQLLFTYDNRFYAVAGKKVVETAKPLDTDEKYASALAACTA